LPVGGKVSRRAERRNGYVHSYAAAGPLDAKQQVPQIAAFLPDIEAMRWRGAIVLYAGLAGGMAGSLAAAEDVRNAVPLPRPRPHISAWQEPRSFREAAGPGFDSAVVTAEPSACRKRLEAMAAIAPMPRLIGPGACGGGDMVRVDAVLLPDSKRVEFRPAPYLRCEMAESLTAWVRDEAAPAVGKAGPALRSIETYDDFDCRGRNRINGARLSEHGKGNAIDLRAFTLADKRTIGLTDMAVPKALRAALRESACARFTTVLGPGSDGYHESHIHLDIAERRNGYRICQWEVREPPPPVPLPPPRPAILAVKDGQKL
jgi:hypothetical protein